MTTHREHPNWAQIRNNIWTVLEQPRTLAPADLREGWSTLFRISHEPSFKAPTVWDVALQLKAPSVISVFELTWDRAAEAQRFFDPLVGLGHRLKFKPVAALSARYATTDATSVRLFDLENLPPLESELVCIDGNHTRVRFFRAGELTANYRWENSLHSHSYDDLIAWKNQTVLCLSELLEKSEAQQIDFPCESATPREMGGDCP